jgi:hypothetical protein
MTYEQKMHQAFAKAIAAYKRGQIARGDRWSAIWQKLQTPNSLIGE